MVNLKINGLDVTVDDNATILEASKKLGMKIPTLCYMNFDACGVENKTASCRVCVVEVKGRRNLAPACATPVNEGMEVFTSTLRVLKARRMNVELLLSDHHVDCPSCQKNNKCQLQSVAEAVGVKSIRFAGKISRPITEIKSVSISKNPSKCILCGRCVTVCNKIQGVGVYSATQRGFETTVATAFNDPMNATMCTSCGQCVAVCPTGALTSVSDIERVWEQIGNPQKHVIVQVAPAVRIALGEEFGYPIGTPVTGKMAAAMRLLGFAKVFDTNFGADVTIVEEASELVARLTSGKNLPMITSCCPGWVNFIEKEYPEMLNLPSSCKSPHEMFGALVKSFYAEKFAVDAKNIVVVSVMPCIAKKDEAVREQLITNGYADVDLVISTRELASMIKEAGIDFAALSDQEFDSPMGESTGAADIFGVTGGVMEAAIRTADFWLNKGKKPVEIKELHTIEGIKLSEVILNGSKVRVAVTSGLVNTRKVLEMVRNGSLEVEAIEIMACPGGCINGAGQPYTNEKISKEIIQKRINGLLSVDGAKKIRISAQNESVIKMYKDYLGEFGGKKAHHLLHTTFKSQKK